MTQAQYARYRNISPQYIGKLVKAGGLVMRGRMVVVSDAVLDDKPAEKTAGRPAAAHQLSMPAGIFSGASTGSEMVRQESNNTQADLAGAALDYHPGGADRSGTAGEKSTCARTSKSKLTAHQRVPLLRRACVAESVIMKITGHRTRGVFERYNITDQSDTLEAGRLAGEFLSRAHVSDSSQMASQNRRAKMIKAAVPMRYSGL